MRRCVYYMPRQAQKDYWEDRWSERDLERLIEGGPKKAWWEDLGRVLQGIDPQALILEAGCGMGQFVYLLHRAGRRVVGVDVADQALRRTRERHPQLDLRLQDVTRLEFPDASVAVYISLGVVEHTREGPQVILREAARVLADDGVLFITVPYYNLFRRLREPWWRIKHWVRRWPLWTRLGWGQIVFYQYAFGRSEFEAILRRAGFVPETHKLHHTKVALTKDLPSTLRMKPKRFKRLLARLERRPWLMSHMMLVVARRAARGEQTGARSAAMR